MNYDCHLGKLILSCSLNCTSIYFPFWNWVPSPQEQPFHRLQCWIWCDLPTKKPSWHYRAGVEGSQLCLLKDILAIPREESPGVVICAYFRMNLAYYGLSHPDLPWWKNWQISSSPKVTSLFSFLQFFSSLTLFLSPFHPLKYLLRIDSVI